MCNMKNCDEAPTWAVNVLDHRKDIWHSFRHLELCGNHVETIEAWEFIEIIDGKELF